MAKTSVMAAWSFELCVAHVLVFLYIDTTKGDIFLPPLYAVSGDLYCRTWHAVPETMP